MVALEEIVRGWPKLESFIIWEASSSWSFFIWLTDWLTDWHHHPESHSLKRTFSANLHILFLLNFQTINQTANPINVTKFLIMVRKRINGKVGVIFPMIASHPQGFVVSSDDRIMVGELRPSVRNLCCFWSIHTDSKSLPLHHVMMTAVSSHAGIHYQRHISTTTKQMWR